ncbi:2-oxoglutarate dehydrogenase E1 component [Planctellipticum variicoloris]|uniref:2-oxoglutarate dehydrogenase E1 component n=1 Tax=Planctellipticum variicoloris TaxID=3064265 RepID=UPI0030134C50|nr:2-oxoglutarate dehydrogenase E1 component [Planctomycetaceae bacterium SH412]
MSPSEVLVPPRAGVRSAPREESGPEQRNGVGAVDSSNLSYVEGLYQEYLKSPDAVSPEWREYFRHVAEASRHSDEAAEQFFRPPQIGEGLVTPAQLDAAILQERVEELIRNYRATGHFAAKLDPLGQPRDPVPELEPSFVGFSESDMDRTFSTLNLGGPNLRTLREILQWLRNTYCRSIGAQFMHIDDTRVREWLQNRMEATENRCQLTRDEQLRILKRLSDAVVFEEFILKKFLGAKSFSLEGAETLVPLLELAIYKAAEQGIEEIVVAMAHRGRLNVLASIMGKSPRAIFREFADLDPDLNVGRGDVKYHLGYSNDWHSGDGRKVHLSLCFNPSHLEFVNTVGMGRVRAKQDRRGDKDRSKVLLVLIHGDAAFPGEGIVQETLNLNQLDATRIGGTMHVIVNNQVGFTTSPRQARSTPYASDVAKMLQIPIFHVNGEDPEAVAQVVRLSMDFRHDFHRDVVIDMYCYRRRGHNEQDEPAFTQPQMYSKIAARPPVGQSYLEHLLTMGEVTREEAERMNSLHRQQLESELEVAKSAQYVHKWDMLHGVWQGYHGGNEREVADVDTGVPVERSAEILEMLTRLPAGFKPNLKLHNGGDPKKPEGILQKRLAMAQGRERLDWSAGETLAYATLSLEGHRVRLHGQDVERGTFSHRHAVLHDMETGETYMPLAHMAADQAPIEIHNSCLSEAGVLGFEYGYSLDWPEGLIVWEAQFGDFVNVAQVIIDQFIVSAEDKWNRLSGLVMLLPHGFEGQGPEHSSARLERFMMLAAEDNIQICYPTTPAQIFHLLRRQVLKSWRKPLIVMSPKSLLRSKGATSSLEDLSRGTFQRVIGDQLQDRPGSEVRQILLCSGKIYYELAERREQLQRNDVAILRVEQLYPVPDRELELLLAQYPNGTPVNWVQEEPENMGAWRTLRCHWGDQIYGRHPLTGVCRPASASPATGSKKSHDNEQAEVIARAFGQVR